jgi:hypothetical protein
MSASQDIDPLLEGSRLSSEIKKVSSMRPKADDENRTWEDPFLNMSSDEENLKKLTEKASKSINFTKYMEGEEAKISKNISLQSSSLGKPK